MSAFKAGFASLSVVSLVACGSPSESDGFVGMPVTSGSVTSTAMGPAVPGAPMPSVTGTTQTGAMMTTTGVAPTLSGSAAPSVTQGGPPTMMTGAMTTDVMAMPTAPSTSTSVTAEPSATTPPEPAGPPAETLDNFEDGD